MKRPYLIGAATAGLAIVALALAFVGSHDSAQAQRGIPVRDGSATFRVITRDDNDQTIVMNNGDLFVLRLGDDFDWNVTIDNPDMFEAVPTFVRDGQGTFRAVKPGETTIHATGGVHCDPGEVCPMLAAVFSVNIVVQ